MTAFEPRCKVCTSSNRKTYEDRYLTSNPKPSWSDLEEQAKVLGEEISYKAFERHFARHFSVGVVEIAQKEEDVSEVVEEKKQEVINIIQEIKNNLNVAKTLIETVHTALESKVSPSLIRSLTDLLREHRQSLETCDRLMGKLTEGTVLSEAEILKLSYLFAKDLCPICLPKYKDALDEYIRRKNEHVSK